MTPYYDRDGITIYNADCRMKRSPIRAVSPRRRRRDAVYPERRRQVFERSYGVCEAYTPVCTGRMTEVHHVAGRTGADPHRLDNLMGMCAPCHQYAHSHPVEAYERGWSVRRNEAA